MSKRSRQRKWRRADTQRRQQKQVALEQDLTEHMQENTIGDLVHHNRLLREIPTPVLAGSQASLPIAIAPTVSQLAHWPACPASCDEQEWNRAMENHDYYLKCAEQDNNAKTWFQYPRQTLQYSEFVYITPEMAQRLLDFNILGTAETRGSNRNIKWPHVEGLKRDIQNHRWLQTHESIAINKLGNMHDGQHRAVAIIKAEIGWPIYVTWNVPVEGVYATDSGDKRPINEKLAFLFPDLKMTHKTAALCRSMMWGLSSRGIRYTESEIAAFMVKQRRVVDWTIQNMKVYRSDLQAVIGKGLLWWGEEIVGPFVERMRTVQFCGDGDPAKALYLWLQSAKQQGRRTAYVSPILYYKKALAALHAHAANKDTKRINAKEQDIFEWLPGWNVPDNAICKGKVFIHSDENPE